MKIIHLVIFNAIQDIEDIEGKGQWMEIVHKTLRIGIIRALNESANRLLRAACSYKMSHYLFLGHTCKTLMLNEKLIK